MKRCSFRSVTLLSLREKAARHVEFDPKVTIIKGPNDTGKSSLIKTLYYTFGARPAQLHPKWQGAEVNSLVAFTFDGDEYSILRSGNRFTVFDAHYKVLFGAGSVGKELAPHFAQFFNFHLHLQSRSNDHTQALPAFLFLPFYMDQDASWGNNWSSFTNLEQFARWRKDVVEYHLGVRPNEYYLAKSGLLRIRVALAEAQEKRTVFQTVLKDLRREAATSDFQLDVEAYRREIEELLISCNKLQAQEETIKRELMSLYNNKAVAEAQISITAASAKELNRDFDFASVGDVVLECPTCGTEHKNSFAERFSIAKDEHRCSELLTELRTQLVKHDDAIRGLKTKHSHASAELDKTKVLLNKKQGDVTLQQLIANEGKREAQAIIQRDIDRINTEIGRIDDEIKQLQSRMKRHEDRAHMLKVRDSHIATMQQNLRTLDVLNLPVERYSKLDNRIAESGSDLPRALLSYYFSILKHLWSNTSATTFPIVLDSPNEKDQDPKNWVKMLEFIRENQPTGSQLILGLVDNAGVEFHGKTINLKDKSALLSQGEYKSLSGKMIDLMNIALNAD